LTGGGWLTVGKLIELFTLMGCRLGELRGEIEGPDGSRKVRHLYNPDSDDFVSLRDYPDDKQVPPGEVSSWERRLKLKIPKPPGWRHRS
jgi:hypothetical protein